MRCLSYFALSFCFWFSMHAHICTYIHTRAHTHTHTHTGIVLIVEFPRFLSVNSLSGAFLFLFFFFFFYIVIVGKEHFSPCQVFFTTFLLTHSLSIWSPASYGRPPHSSIPSLWPCTHLGALLSDAQHFCHGVRGASARSHLSLSGQCQSLVSSSENHRRSKPFGCSTLDPGRGQALGPSLVERVFLRLDLLGCPG